MSDYTKLCRLLFEMLQQAPSDFAGEQRAFYLPRLRDAMVLATELFPQHMARAVEKIMEDEGPYAGLSDGQLRAIAGGKDIGQTAAIATGSMREEDRVTASQATSELARRAAVSTAVQTPIGGSSEGA